MYFIAVKYKTKPEWTDRFLDLVASFTEDTRAEPGNLWFEWSRSIDDPSEFVLVEGFADDGAGPHVNSDRSKRAITEIPAALIATPKIVSRQVIGDAWDDMAEMRIS
jgi:quinol monooxygenase YgiN